MPGQRIEGIVERRIREAQARGLFENLPGAGRPLTHLGGPRDESWWLREYLVREGLSGVPFLPPALALRKAAENLPETVVHLPTESQVREVVDKLNERIRAALAKPADGPSMTLMQIDVNEVVLNWRLARIAARTRVRPGINADHQAQGGDTAAGATHRAAGDENGQLPARWHLRFRRRPRRG